MTTENTEKIARIARVRRLARKIFTTDEAVSQWFASPAPALGGCAPVDKLDTEMGTQEVEAVLNAIGYGNVL